MSTSALTIFSTLPEDTVDNVLGFILGNTKTVSNALSIVKVQNPQLLRRCEIEVQRMILDTIDVKEGIENIIKEGRFSAKVSDFFNQTGSLKRLADKQARAIDQAKSKIPGDISVETGLRTITLEELITIAKEIEKTSLSRADLWDRILTLVGRLVHTLLMVGGIALMFSFPMASETSTFLAGLSGTMGGIQLVDNVLAMITAAKDIGFIVMNSQASEDIKKQASQSIKELDSLKEGLNDTLNQAVDKAKVEGEAAKLMKEELMPKATIKVRKP